jgi:hypothetical protein
MSTEKTALLPAARIERRILLLRNEKVLLDSDLAELYGVEARVLNQAVKRNIGRFPADFMFRLTVAETQLVRELQTPDSSQTVTSSGASPKSAAAGRNSSQIVMSSKKHRGLAYRPYAFTEQGVAMLSSVLRSERAVQVNIAIMRTFVQLRRMLASHADLAQKLKAMEQKYDKQFSIVFDAIRALMAEEEKPKREIGFHTLMPKPGQVNGVKSKKRI